MIKPIYDNIDKCCAFGWLNSPPRHPRRKDGDAFAVDRTITNRPYIQNPAFCVKPIFMISIYK